MPARSFTRLQFSLVGLLLAITQTAGAPANCIGATGSTTIRNLVNCFNGYTVPHDTYTDITYNAAQPSTTERTAWVTAVNALLNVDGNCAAATVPSAISSLYRIDLFTESAGAGKSYCVLSESTITSGGYYTKGWGLFAVPATAAAVDRDVHFSAPHPQADSNTPQQAAALFGSTSGRTLLVHGRNRTSYFDGQGAVSGCVAGSGSTVYYKADAAHDNTQPFFDAAVAIRTWQNANGGCPSATCAYLQLHGKGTNTCASDDVFLSTGLGTGSSSIAWYTDAVDRPIKRLKTRLQTAFPSWTISMPSDSSCGLTATGNIFGRLLNGVALASVCTTAGTASGATGQFIHAEQATASRAEASYDEWTTAIINAF